MTLNPEIQQIAREEIDSVIGTDRLPNFSDRDQLSYVQRIVQETFRFVRVPFILYFAGICRWNPVLPLSRTPSRIRLPLPCGC